MQPYFDDSIQSESMSSKLIAIGDEPLDEDYISYLDKVIAPMPLIEEIGKPFQWDKNDQNGELKPLDSNIEYKPLNLLDIGAEGYDL